MSDWDTFKTSFAQQCINAETAMSEIKHTPGPWGVSSQSPRIIKKYDDLGETNVILGSASAYPQSGFFESDESAIANARLMAAAPELLELLLELVDIEGPQPGNAAWGEKVHAAIAKATGSQS
jgi:hypothetical protein